MNEQGLSDFLVPPGTEEILAVFVNGVEKKEGEDFTILPDRVRFHPPLVRRERVSRIGSILLSVGIGVYPKGDIVDVQVRRRGVVDVVRGRPVDS
ncbi:MAG: hypothetical protein QOI43_1063 [Gaiellales bacterium]|nr:hypothetical protein [Gaiellales bacterium]